ncbi:MAG: transglutaminase domain-containing protein [Candidatus Omnitrophica bacterium]|nr:transglutaminase domain-containing protein [Candidatus Omnitrophota bacterium]
MNEFLQETKFCDCKHRSIINKSCELTKDLPEDKDKAIALFNFVRDNIKYSFDRWDIKASETLERGRGMCTNKSNLLIAMLRSCNIPAAYGILKVDAQNFFGPLMLPMLKNKVSKNSVHIYAQIYINGKWIKCDSSTDAELASKAGGIYSIAHLVELADDNHEVNIDKIISFDKEHIYEDLGPFANIDDKLIKKPKNANFLLLSIGNSFLIFLRTEKKQAENSYEMQKNYVKWLKNKNFPLYLILKLYCHV